MFKLNKCFVFCFVSCEKKVVMQSITSNDGVQARLPYAKNGYSEIEINPIV